jgi:hypothetical protein
MKQKPSGMNQRELAFIIMVVGAYILMLIKVGFESQKWSQIEFIFAYFGCILIFIQFLIRYLAITHIYKTEASIAGWVVSFLIFVASIVFVQASLNFPLWFLAFGILLLLGSLKNIQSRKQIMTATKYNIERVLRLKEYMIFEAGFGVFMILFSIFAKWGTQILPQFTPDSTVFFGTLFAIFYILISTLIMVIRMLTNRSVIEKHMKDMP